MPECPVCGRTVDEDARFCSGCGARIPSSEEDQQASRTVQDMALEYEAMVREHPDNADARYSLGLARLYEGNWGPAAEQFQRVVELTPDFADAHANLAIALAKLEEFVRAREAIKAALSLSPGSARFRKLHDQLQGL